MRALLCHLSSLSVRGPITCYNTFQLFSTVVFFPILSFLSLRISGRRRQRSHKMKHLVSVAERKKSGTLATNHAPEIGSLTWRPPPVLRFLFCDRTRLCMTPRHKLCNEPARIFLVLFAVVAESGEATGTTQDSIGLPLHDFLLHLAGTSASVFVLLY